MSKNHLAGGKLTKSHTTLIDAALPFVRVAQKIPEVSKISLGVITANIRVGKHHVKFLPITGGWKIVVRGTNSIQEVYVYTSSPEKTKKLLLEVKA